MNGVKFLVGNMLGVFATIFIFWIFVVLVVTESLRKIRRWML